ncbi:MAG: DNA polymerase [Tissierellia bacterium]|nr:DNA polymerase [Tissierellia bacterium]
MKHLSIDIETYSSEPIGKTGLYKYAQSEDFEILLFAYSVDFGEVKIVDLAQGESIPEDIILALNDKNVIKHAYNAPFEWYCLNQVGYKTEIGQWVDTMIHGLYLGYTAGLAATGKALGLPEDKQKLNTGKALIRYFCVPCKATKSNGGRTRNLPKHDLKKWKLFKEYCIQDVITETEIYNRLKLFPIPEREQNLWVNDIKMNAKGILVDEKLIHSALEINDIIDGQMVKEAKEISNVENPNSTSQLLEYLRENGLDELDNLQKGTVSELLESGKLCEDNRRLLEIRQELSKTSIKKYVAMDIAKGTDNRVRGLLQFYGANRTGRWAGRLVQVQNLPRNYLSTLNDARGLVKEKNIQGLELIYGNVSDTLSQLIRTAFIPSKDKLIIADFSAIEARIIAWLAGERWVQDVFASHGKIYEATASQMFGVPIEKIKRGNPEYSLRQKGKIAQLALGYQGSIGAMKAMGALNMGLTEDELPDIVSRWRNANQNIVKLWYEIEENALAVMMDSQPRTFRGLTFARESEIIYGQDFFTIKLPSGRKLYYPKPFLKENKFGKVALHYYSVNQTSRKWSEDSTYGGKLTENIVQAIARDCLAESIIRVSERYPQAGIVMHIHDEIVMDCQDNISVNDVCEIMGEPIDWAPGLILKAAGFESEYYMKD